MQFLKLIVPKKPSFILRIAVLAFSVFVLVSFIQLRLQLNEGQQRLDELNDQVEAYAEIKTELEEQKSSYEEFLEQQARKNGMAKPGETIFVEIPSVE